MKQKPSEVKNHSLQESEIKNICSAIIGSIENYQKQIKTRAKNNSFICEVCREILQKRHRHVSSYICIHAIKKKNSL